MNRARSELSARTSKTGSSAGTEINAKNYDTSGKNFGTSAIALPEK